MLISYKHKKSEELLEELQEKGVTLLIDVRRKPIHERNSALWFLPKQLEASLSSKGIQYLWRPRWSNYTHATTAVEYSHQFGDSKPWLEDKLPETHQIIGLACYCPEENQRQGKCHASWLRKILQGGRPKETRPTRAFLGKWLDPDNER